jgi:ribosomal protein S14
MLIQKPWKKGHRRSGTNAIRYGRMNAQPEKLSLCKNELRRIALAFVVVFLK